MSSILRETAGQVEVARLTVDQYEAMIEQGILREGEPIELIDGVLVLEDRARAGGEPMTVGPQHQLVVNEIARLAARFEERGCFLSIHGPLRLLPDNEPAPDVTVVRGRPEDHADQHPGAASIDAVIEVADSSLHRDRTTKLRVYAAAGLRLYLIVNLVDRLHEDPADGAYHARRVLGGDDLIDVSGVALKARDLLP